MYMQCLRVSVEFLLVETTECVFGVCECVCVGRLMGMPVIIYGEEFVLESIVCVLLNKVSFLLCVIV